MVKFWNRKSNLTTRKSIKRAYFHTEYKESVAVYLYDNNDFKIVIDADDNLTDAIMRLETTKNYRVLSAKTKRARDIVELPKKYKNLKNMTFEVSANLAPRNN